MSNKYAVFKQGSKQYRVEEGEVLDVDLLQAEAGASVEFPEVLFAHDGKSAHVGKPTLKGYSVKCEVVGEAKGPKISSLKYKPSHTTCRRFGHRQHYTRVKVVSITHA